jgi:hypothetical protein
MGRGKVHLKSLEVLLIRVITICKLVRVFHGFSQVGDSYYMVIPLVIQSMGQTALSQSIKIQNSAKVTFLKCGLGVEISV